MQPYLNAESRPVLINRIIKPETSRDVIRMMTSAVIKNKIATINNFQVAGKTGTANIPDFERGGYSDELIHTYVGFAPASNPKFVILMKLDKPKVGELAGLTVVPGFRRLAEFILNYYNIPPDNLVINDSAGQSLRP